MGIADAYQADTDRAIQAMVTTPVLPQAPEPKSSVWSALPRAIAAAAAERMAGIGEVIKGYGEVAGSLGDSGGGMFSLQSDTEREQAQAAREAIQTRGVQGRNQVSDALRDVSEGYRSDPATASTAENIVFGLTKGLAKAGLDIAVAGPFGAAAFGLDEGLTTMDDLQRQGVDDVTAAKAGALTGVATGASVMLPVLGPTAGKTVGLALAGGPGAFVAQQAATREILKDADYGAIAEQFDPLDPVGLTLSTLIPAVFAGVHIRGLVKSTGAPKVAPEAVDAAMVHNLTVQQDMRAGAPEPVLPLVPPARDVVARADDVPAPKLEEDAAVQRVKQLVEAEDAPAVVVRKTEDGADVTAKQEMERARQEIEEGTEFELGRLDADLLKVAAECALSLG